MASTLLVLSFFFPPCGGVGARRWGFLSRFLTEKGIVVSVATSPLNGSPDGVLTGQEKLAVHVADSPSRRPPTLPRLPFLEEWLTWHKPFQRLLDRLIRQERPQLLTFTGGPFFPFVMAPDLARRHGIPYWLDFRDAWNLGSHITLRGTSPLMRHLERRAVLGALLITDVTPEMSALRRAAFPKLPSERFRVLANGFDGDPGIPLSPSSPGQPLRLAIWGKFSPYDLAHPRLLLAALTELAAETPVEIHHFGNENGERPLVAAAENFGLVRAIHFHGYCDYEQGMAMLAAMDALVINHRSPLMVGTKVYDAIRLNRPILALCRPGDALARLLRPFRHAYPAATIAAAAAALLEIGRTRPGCLDPDLDPWPYSRKQQAQDFLPFLTTLLGPR